MICSTNCWTTTYKNIGAWKRIIICCKTTYDTLTSRYRSFKLCTTGMKNSIDINSKIRTKLYIIIFCITLICWWKINVIFVTKNIKSSWVVCIRTCIWSEQSSTSTIKCGIITYKSITTDCPSSNLTTSCCYFTNKLSIRSSNLSIWF